MHSFCLIIVTVPNAYDSEIRLTGLDWSDSLLDPKSPRRRDITEEIEAELESMFRGARVRIVEYREGSVIVKFR